MKRFTLLALLLAVAACKTTRKPGPDSTNVATDSAKVDTTYPAEFPPEPPLNPADTVITAHDSAAMRARRQARAVSGVGIPAGATTYAMSYWCSGAANGTVIPGNVTVIAAVVRKAAFCGMRNAMSLPRSEYTTNGEQRGPFSLKLYKDLIDREAQAMPLAFRQQHGPSGDGAMWYVSGLDDINSLDSWGGERIPLDTVLAAIRYAKAKLAPWPVCLRVEPTQLQGINWGGDLPCTVDQWHRKKGPRNLDGQWQDKQEAWYTQQDDAGQRIGVRFHIRAVNLGHIEGADSREATAAEVRVHVGQAIKHKSGDLCASFSWEWLKKYETDPDFKSAWADVFALARGVAKKACS